MPLIEGLYWAELDQTCKCLVIDIIKFTNEQNYEWKGDIT